MDNPQTQRSYSHDYKAPAIYLLTVTVEGRRPLLGRLAGDVSTVHIELSPLGEDVRHELYALCDRYPQLRLLQYQIMPDHVHVILQVTERLQKPLGSLLSSWKIACGHAYARTSATPGASAGKRDKAGAIPGASAGPHDKADTTTGSATAAADLSGASALAPAGFVRLFSEGYNDRILQGKGQLQRMIDYVRDNPRRLLLKRANSPYFTIHRRIDVAGHTFDAIGNLALLQRPLLAVHCRRHWTESEQQTFSTRCMQAAEEGTVLIGAFISKAEQAIAQQANERHLPLIHLMENGFPELYKPVGQAFYTCAEGRLLQLAPWKHHAGHKAISREQCNALNTMAETIATTINIPK